MGTFSALVLLAFVFLGIILNWKSTIFKIWEENSGRLAQDVGLEISANMKSEDAVVRRNALNIAIYVLLFMFYSYPVVLWYVVWALIEHQGSSFFALVALLFTLSSVMKLIIQRRNEVLIAPSPKIMIIWKMVYAMPTVYLAYLFFVQVM